MTADRRAEGWRKSSRSLNNPAACVEVMSLLSPAPTPPVGTPSASTASAV